MRLALAGAILAATVLPMAGAKAANSCNDILFYSGVRATLPSPVGTQGLSLYPSALTCGVDPEDASSTDVILPGTNWWRVTWNRADQPADGVVVDGFPTGSYLTFGVQTILLKFVKPTGGTTWRSDLDRDPVASANGGVASVHVCTFDLSECQDRTFRTLA